MKEITSMCANFIAQIPNEGQKFIPEIEVALIISEITYRIGVTGELQKDRTCETVRFVSSADSLRKLAETLTRYAHKCETHLSEALREHTAGAVRAATATYAQDNKQPAP